MDNASRQAPEEGMLRHMNRPDAQNSAGAGAPRRRIGAAPPEPGGTGARVLADSAGPDADGLRRVAAVTHEHLVPLRLLETATGQVELVRVPSPEPTLDALLDERRYLRPGESVTVLVPVARAVAAVHAAGLLVGGLEPADVHLDPAGRPVLAMPRLPVAAVTPTDRASCAEPWDEDVRDLARLGWTMLTGKPPSDATESLLALVPEAPRPLAGLLGAVLDAPAGRLPGAAELATALLAACPPEPVRAPATWVQPPVDPPLPVESPEAKAGSATATREARGGGRSSRPSSGGHRRRRDGRPRRSPLSRASLAAATALTLVIVVAGFTARQARGPHAPLGQPVASRVTEARAASSSAPRPSPPTPRTVPGASSTLDGRYGWVAVLTELDRRRADALARPGGAALDLVYVVGSPAFRRDAALAASYAAHGAHVEGLRDHVVSVTAEPSASASVVAASPAPAGSGAGVVRLLVRDRLAAYEVIAADGRTVHRAARGVRAWVVELRAVKGEWRMWDVRAADSGGRA